MTDAPAAARAAPHPTGTVTLLFTDIEGSTQHWERQSAAMPDTLRRHDDIVRAAIEKHGGHVFKTVGDAFCAAFWHASDAAGAAAEAQLALTTADWDAIGGLSVRMALHSGSTHERDGDYFGPAVNRVARLMAAANGGQVVVSGATAQLLRGAMRGEIELRDLGELRLKDLDEPEHVWQLLAPGLIETFPPLRSLQGFPNNLPQPVTSLIGRDDVLAEIEPLVRERQLVTIVGAGGIGKTRVALHVGSDLLAGLSDGSWFVDLAPLSDSASIVSTITAAFGLREQAKQPALETLTQYLRSRSLLLILDNCEHLIEETARVAAAILRAAPQVRLLATSREPLRIDGEQVYRLPSLAVPPDGALTADMARQYGAVALFTERASASDRSFRLSDEVAPTVAEICRRVDGIALAIELAAARVRILPPRQLAQRLDERFRVLTGGSRTALPRHQTMRALIDWSHDLLGEEERAVFRRTAIFSGGWTLEAAEAVCGDETLSSLDVIDLLSSLVEKSLVAADTGESPRYRLLESTRAFALEKLEERGERDALARRHARWLADAADRAEEATRTVPTSRWHAEFAPEMENVRSAMEWALSNGEIILAARIAVGFSRAYRNLVGEAEPRRWFHAVLARLDADAQPALTARVYCALAAVAVGSDGIAAARRAIELGERCNDVIVTTMSLSSMAFGLLLAGRVQDAQDACDRALQLSKENGLTGSFFHVHALNVAGSIANECGRVEEARQWYAQALTHASALGNEFSTISIEMNMAELEFQAGNPKRALELVRNVKAETVLPRANSNVIGSLVNAAAYQLVLADVAGAGAAAREALRLARGASWLFTTVAIQHLATVAALSGDPRRGARLRGYVDASYRKGGNNREPTEQRTYDILTAALREKLAEGEIESLAAEGAPMSEDQAVAQALVGSV